LSGVNVFEEAEADIPQTLAGKTLVVTGTLTSYSRSEIETAIRNHGGKAASSVSKNTDYLLAGTDPGSKLQKAQTIGVKVINEEQFKELLAGKEV
jgi:DNA ligase (NAD+)